MASCLWHSHYSDQQELLFEIFEGTHDVGMSYRKVAQWMNKNNEH